MTDLERYSLDFFVLNLATGNADHDVQLFMKYNNFLKKYIDMYNKQAKADKND